MSADNLIIIVGAGISGCVLAERYANTGKKVVVIEKRNHIGGNCFDFIDESGIRVSKYGAHLFHTNYQDVWDYVQQFSQWYPYVHRVVSKVKGKLVPVPVNITTVNSLFNLEIADQNQMEQWLANETINTKTPSNSEESALSRVGPRLYEMMFKNYTKKQWDLWPHQLEASVMDRIPVRTNFDDRYFSDKYQFLPHKGYTQLFKKMLNHPNITLKLNTNFFNSKYNHIKKRRLYFTGPIDRFFKEKFGKLQYRSLEFKFETHPKKFYQKNSVVNYPDEELFTRIVEYKHFSNTPNNISYTTISKEYGRWKGEPYYPVPNHRNRKIYSKYQQAASETSRDGVYFVGRLANYKYFNMDQAFKNALDLFESHN